ncbi:MAG: helix-turn-helix domain-containing protein [Actinomycetota bacterium]|nr:helix-turn-helix domain-containing protein [Actinomycetota bacterium]
MARGKARPERNWTASQVVAHNLTRARELRGITQTEIAERLTRFTGANWSQATVAQAEGSVGGQRVRQFTANELVALARTFDLPVLFFFLPPDEGEGLLVTSDAPHGLAWEYLLLLVLGHEQNQEVLEERTANWYRSLVPTVTIPRGDVLDHGRPADIPGLQEQRSPLLPEDLLATAFHGLAARKMRGARRPGKEVAKFAENLRGLADALDAFNNSRPGTFLNLTTANEIAAERRRRHEEEWGHPAPDAEEAGDE